MTTATDGAGIKFTIYETDERLSKSFARSADGKTVVIEGTTNLARGKYRVVTVAVDDIPTALREIGATIDALTCKAAIGIGVPHDRSTAGEITTQKKRKAGAIPRDKEHFGWPDGHGLLFLDGDDREGLFELLRVIYPPLADVAMLARPSVSASVADPLNGGKALKTGEHGFAVIDKPERARDCLFALMRLAWVHGSGDAAGWLKLTKRGDVLERGPVDTCVGSPERLVYEGAGEIKDDLIALPRVARVTGGSGVLSADDLIAYADANASEQQFCDLVAAAKADPAFIKQRDERKAAYRADHIAKGKTLRVKKGMAADEAEQEATAAYDAVAAAGSCEKDGRTWIPLADDHVLYWPEGGEFTIVDIRAHPLLFNGKECADPVEGLDYQSRNPAIIYTNHNDQIEIYSRAHGDSFAYVAPLDDTPWAEVFAQMAGDGDVPFDVFVGDDGVTRVATRNSEEALALEFSAKHAGELRYTAAWGKWHLWDGLRWAEDRTLKVFDLARRVCREAAARLQGGSKEISKAKTRAAVVSLASNDRRHAAVVEQWDADIWKLCTPGGVVDLKTGVISPAHPSYYMTKMTAVAPGGECPLWLAHLERVTGSNKGLIRYLQVLSGYALTGSVEEHILVFFWGTGRNGKGVTINTFMGAMGDYAAAAPSETFTETKNERHPTDLAGLRGARLVTASETEQGQRWAETKIKKMTGGDPIPARFMRGDFFTYTPQYTLIVIGNHRPGLRSVDEAIKARLKLVPFTVTIPEAERDPKLEEKLKAEWGGILKWMIEGCLIWQKEGLVTPDIVKAATDEYLEAEDAVGRWLDECCVLEPQAKTLLAHLFEDWTGWAERNREYPYSAKRLSSELKNNHKFKTVDIESGLAFVGLKLQTEVAEQKACDERADELFLNLLARFSRDRRGVGPDPASKHYAPKLFAGEAEAKQGHWTVAQMTAAMERLRAAGKVLTVVHGDGDPAEQWLMSGTADNSARRSSVLD